MIGKTIGKYRFVEQLGRGGSGAVYKALDETLDREVAIKVLEAGVGDSALLKRFQAEAATLARLHHPDIVSIHEFHQAESELLMVMELVRGETLEQLAARCGPLPPERAAYLVAQVLGAIDHAHSAGVVHRDLKPSNVMVTEQGNVKVMDFGFARMAGAEQMTADGITLAAPSYMAPERLLGKEVDGRADVYSAGVVFYRLLTGRVPHEAATPLEMVQKQLADTPTPAQKYRPELPGWCQAILDRALARSPDDRFSTADAFRAALLAAIGEATETTGVMVVPRPTSAAQRAIRPDAATGEMPMHAEPVTVATLAPPRKTEAREVPPPLPELAPTNSAPVPIAAAGTTLVLKKNQFAAVGALLAALVLGVIVLAVLALRQPATVVVPPTDTASLSTTPAAATAASDATVSAPAVAATPAPAGAVQAAAEIVAPQLVLPPPGPAPSRSVGAAPPTGASSAAPPKPRKIAMPPFQFEARAVVADGDKRRERDALVVLADGAVTVKEKDRSEKAIYVVPLDTVVGLTYSSSRQPLWSSPDGPAEAMRVEGGAFGFLKGGGVRNWFGLRTKDSLLFVRVEDAVVATVTTGLQDHTGLTIERLTEPKD